ncbi:hypothetical protein, partial [Paraburkholderia sp. BR10954]|uniref:hypothetical protein n=1 Tax=Paraburkholderia sp. BR10954 TaxID=3236995 RepID=UPI0034D38CDB
HPDLDRICRKLPIICQVPANASTTFRFKPLLQKALRIVQVRLSIMHLIAALADQDKPVCLRERLLLLGQRFGAGSVVGF